MTGREQNIEIIHKQLTNDTESITHLFKCQLHKMVKHTQIEGFFVGLALKGLNIPHKIIIATVIIIITIIINVAKEKLTHLNSLLHIYT